jgi:hypothetical protein
MDLGTVLKKLTEGKYTDIGASLVSDIRYVFVCWFEWECVGVNVSVLVSGCV